MVEALVVLIMCSAAVLFVIAVLFLLDIRDAWINGEVPEEPPVD